jgi:aryl-alcohol dehydrogenase-like predicted oxidoreductase
MANYQFKPADRMSTNKMHPVGRDYPVMRKRSLGETGLSVGEIGFGTGAFGRVGAGAIPDDEALDMLGYALDMEASLIDTAPTYGGGRAEKLVGQALRGRRSQAVVVTKAGYFSDGHADYSATAIRSSLEASLERMHLGFVDALLLHNPPLEVLTQASEAFGELAKLKKEGKIRAYGACVVGAVQAKAALEKTESQVLEAPYNIFHQEIAGAFEALGKKRVGFIASQPLDSGFLSGRYGKLAFFTDERSRFSREEITRRAALIAKLEALGLPAPGDTETQVALEFVLASHAVTCALPGASSWQQVIGNVTACQRRMDPAVAQALRGLWEREIKTAPLAL